MAGLVKINAAFLLRGDAVKVAELVGKIADLADRSGVQLVNSQTSGSKILLVDTSKPKSELRALLSDTSQ